MRCYSHLSDDEREQIGLAKALGHSIGAIAKRSAVRSRRSGANSPATGCRAGNSDKGHSTREFAIRFRALPCSPDIVRCSLD